MLSSTAPACWWCGSTTAAGLTRDMRGWVCAEPTACYDRGRRNRGQS
jgi:hypothetical protein